MITQTIKKQIVPILKRQGAIKIALFGSAARDEIKKKSDIDILIKFKREKSLLDLVRPQFELEKKWEGK